MITTEYIALCRFHGEEVSISPNFTAYTTHLGRLFGAKVMRREQVPNSQGRISSMAYLHEGSHKFPVSTFTLHRCMGMGIHLESSREGKRLEHITILYNLHAKLSLCETDSIGQMILQSIYEYIKKCKEDYSAVLTPQGISVAGGSHPKGKLGFEGNNLIYDNIVHKIILPIVDGLGLQNKVIEAPRLPFASASCLTLMGKNIVFSHFYSVKGGDKEGLVVSKPINIKTFEKMKSPLILEDMNIFKGMAII